MSVTVPKTEIPAVKKPHIFRRFWEGWKRFGRKLADVQARIILVLFYFIILAPFALIVRLFSDPLAMKKRDNPTWHSREKDLRSSEEKAYRQF